MAAPTSNSSKYKSNYAATQQADFQNAVQLAIVRNAATVLNTPVSTKADQLRVNFAKQVRSNPTGGAVAAFIYAVAANAANDLSTLPDDATLDQMIAAEWSAVAGVTAGDQQAAPVSI